jgi:hypothetical protein
MTMTFLAAPDTSGDSETEGMLWADIWINLAFCLFAAVSEPAPQGVIPGPNVATQGGAAAHTEVVQFYLRDGSAPILRLGSATGTLVGEDGDLANTIAAAYGRDPQATFVIVAPGAVPASSLILAAARLERAGAKALTLALSADGG